MENNGTSKSPQSSILIMNMFKTTSANTPEEYINLIEDPKKKEDVQFFHEFIRKTVPALEPFMISGMIGYGKYTYKTKTREGEWCTLALAAQKNYISLYVCAVDEKGYIAEQYKDKFPKASIGKSCIRFKKREDLDLDQLETVIKLAPSHQMSLG